MSLGFMEPDPPGGAPGLHKIGGPLLEAIAAAAIMLDPGDK